MTDKVLFVDDDECVLDGYVRNLRRTFDIDTANSGADGLEAIEKDGPYAVVVSDMMMPEMDGVQFLARVNGSCPNTVKIMLTGDAHLWTAVYAAREAHVFRFLCKPCPMDDLVEAIKAALQKYHDDFSRPAVAERCFA